MRDINQSTDVRQAYDNAGELLDQANWFNISFSPTLTFTYNSSGLLQALSGVPQVYKATMDTVEQFTYNNDGTTASEILLGWSEVAQLPYTLYGWATLNMNNAGPGPSVTPLSVSFGYNNDAQLTAIYRADESVNSTVTNAWTAGPTTTLTYSTGRLASEITSEGGSNLVSYSYSSYDTDNQLKNAKFSDASNTTVSFAYTYTPDNQLASENDTGTYNGSSYGYSFGNSYDNNGNRTGSGISTGANNEIGTQGSMAYLYDNNGNRLLAAQMSGATLTAYNDYNFDPRNRLSNVIAPWVSQSVNYTYDPSNRRIEEQDVNTTTTTYTEFAYDPGGALVMELNKGATSVTDTYLPDRAGGVAPLAHEDASGNVTWLLGDRNGTVQDVVTNSGTFSDKVLYNAFGQKEEPDSGTASIFGFQGEQQPLSSTPSGIFALNRNGVSWTDPALQNAFISPDPKGFAAGTNAYERDGNNPVNNIDPTGLEFSTGTSSPGISAFTNPFLADLQQQSSPQGIQQAFAEPAALPPSVASDSDKIEWSLNLAAGEKSIQAEADLLTNSAVGATYNQNPTAAYWESFVGGSPTGQMSDQGLQQLNPISQTTAHVSRGVAIMSLSAATGGAAGGAYAGWLGADLAATLNGTLATGALSGAVGGATYNTAVQFDSNQPFSVSSLGQGTASGAAWGMGGSLVGYGVNAWVMNPPSLPRLNPLNYNVSVNPSTLGTMGGNIRIGYNAPVGPLTAGQSGSFAELDNLSAVGDQLTPHHMPQAALEFTPYEQGGAIALPQSQHILTRTYGFSGAQLVQQEAGLPFRTVLGRDIRDLRNIAGSQYDPGIRNLFQYYRQNFPDLIAK